MLYTGPQGTPLYKELEKKGTLLGESEIDLADVHGQYRFNYRHPHIKEGQESKFLLRAFQRDFELNGPSVMRILPTIMEGWMKYKNHPEARIRKRFAKEVEKMPVYYAGALWATRRWFKGNSRVTEKMTDVLNDIYKEFGLKSFIAAPIVGRIVLYLLCKEEKRLAGNYSYEPPTFYETSARVVQPRTIASQQPE